MENCVRHKLILNQDAMEMVDFAVPNNISKSNIKGFDSFFYKIEKINTPNTLFFSHVTKCKKCAKSGFVNLKRRQQ